MKELTQKSCFGSFFNSPVQMSAQLVYVLLLCILRVVTGWKWMHHSFKAKHLGKTQFIKIKDHQNPNQCWINSPCNFHWQIKCFAMKISSDFHFLFKKTRLVAIMKEREKEKKNEWNFHCAIGNLWCMQCLLRFA